MSLYIDGVAYASLHFTGVLGSGMSALAYYCIGEDLAVSGSDRLMHSADIERTYRALTDAGCVFHPQDGSAIARGAGAVVVSTAIEEDNPDIAAARRFGIPVFHRSDVLAAIVSGKKTIAVAGTSGKSTVAAMIFELLCACGKQPSLITGAPLICLEEQGGVGNAYNGGGELLVIEADESDGSLIKYRPEISIFLNVSKDHKPVEEVRNLFEVLARQSACVVVNADEPAIDMTLSTTSFGLRSGDFRPDAVDAVAPSVRFRRAGVVFELPLPGMHNASNAVGALCVCSRLGCTESLCAEALRAFKGVKRRFNSIALSNGITVIDDFAHNPEKVRAAVTTAKLMSRRVFAIFQPHGFGPTRFLKDDFARVFSEVFDPEDALFLLPIYYAGGTARQDISSMDVASLIFRNKDNVFTPRDRDECIAMVKARAASGDAVLLMGARDPSLSSFARAIAEALERT